MKSLLYYTAVIIILTSCQKKFLCPDCIDNKPPVARAGTDQIILSPADNTTLDGDASTDPDGSISLYKWAKISGPASFVVTDPASAKTNITALVKGIYKFELTVTDDGGLSAKDSIQITVEGLTGNQPPVANAGNVQPIITSDFATLNGSQSYDPDGSVVSYEWVQIAGPGQATIERAGKAETVVSDLVSGSYRFQLTVADNGGLLAKDTIAINVQLSSCSATNLNWSPDSETGMMALINPAIVPYPATLDCGHGAESFIPAHYDVTVQFEGSVSVRHLVYVSRANIPYTTIDIFLSSIIYVDPNEGEVSIPIVYARTDAGTDFTKRVTVVNTK